MFEIIEALILNLVTLVPIHQLEKSFDEYGRAILADGERVPITTIFDEKTIAVPEFKSHLQEIAARRFPGEICLAIISIKGVQGVLGERRRPGHPASITLLNADYLEGQFRFQSESFGLDIKACKPAPEDFQLAFVEKERVSRDENLLDLKKRGELPEAFLREYGAALHIEQLTLAYRDNVYDIEEGVGYSLHERQEWLEKLGTEQDYIARWHDPSYFYEPTDGELRSEHARLSIYRYYNYKEGSTSSIAQP